jgi:MoaA/NifB/PqqE/SkfB family radical SAM enzyme
MNSVNSDLKAWQRSAIRNTMANYRRAQDNYYVGGKPLVELEDGYKAFSLLTPPLGSPAARRRVKLIMENMLQSGGVGAGPANFAAAGRTPHVITMAVTYNCQCDCLHCSAVDYQEKTRRDGSALKFEELKSVIDQTVDLGTTCVVLTGGEPLLYERIYDLIAAVDKHRSVCTIFTNGEFLLEHTVARLKRAGVYGVFVSLDHFDAARHDDHRRRPGLAGKAYRGLKLCQDAGILTGVSTYATKENIRNGELEAMMDRARSLGVLEVFLFDVIPTGRLAAQHECMLSDEDARQIVEFRARYTEKPDYPRIIHQTMFSSIAYPCVAEGCPAGMVQVHLRANGDVCPCDFTPYSFGNIRQQPLKEIWESMSAHALYAEPSARCRLSQPGFWVKLEELAPGCSSAPAAVPAAR